MTLIYFRGLLTRLQRGQGNFATVPAVYVVGGKVGEGWKDEGEVFGKWVETTDLPSPHMECSDVSEFEHICGHIFTTPSCVYDRLFT